MRTVRYFIKNHIIFSGENYLNIVWWNITFEGKNDLNSRVVQIKQIVLNTICFNSIEYYLITSFPKSTLFLGIIPKKKSIWMSMFVCSLWKAQTTSMRYIILRSPNFPGYLTLMKRCRNKQDRQPAKTSLVKHLAVSDRIIKFHGTRYKL